MPTLLKPLFSRAFLFLFILGLVSAYATLPPYKTAHIYDNTYPELLFDVYVLSAILLLIPKTLHIRKRTIPLRLPIKAVVYVFLYALYIVDTFCFVKFGSTLNPSMLLLIGETNSNEASEFFSNYLSPDILLSEVGLIALVPLCHVITAILWKRYKNKVLSLSFFSRLHLPRWGTWAANVVMLVAIVTLGYLGLENKRLYVHTMTSETIGEVEHSLAYRPHTEMYQPPMRLAFSIRSNELIARQLDRLINQLNRARVDSCSTTSPNIVLIIGESFNKRHAQLYGYDKPNMPNQVRMKHQGLLTPLEDVVSPWNLTSFVFKHLMTTYCVGDTADWCDYPLFCQLFRQAGYRVTFLTNQFLPQAKEAVYDFSGGFFLNNPKTSAAQFDLRNDKLHVFDEGLLSDFDDIPAEQRKGANLTIFHLMGQHVNYRVRCPNSKKKFGKDDYPNDMDLTEKRRKALADYDNAVWYNDSVVNQIVERFKNDDAIIVYLSDHGEEVFGPGVRHFCGRMHDAVISKRLADEEFRIPMWIYCTRKYRRSHPDIARAIKQAKNKPYMTDALSHLLLGLAGIHTPAYRPEYDLLSPQYNAKRPRILKNTTDYDKF